MKKGIYILFFTFFLTSCFNDNAQVVEQKEVGTIDNPQVILTLGDSLTAGYGLSGEESYPGQLSDRLESSGYHYEVINGGVSGNTSADLLSRAELYLDQDPNIVILVIGGNDGLRGMSTEALEKNILAIADIFLDQGIPVVLGGMDIPINLGLNYRREFRAVYDHVENARDNIYHMEKFLEDVIGVAKYNQPDRIHPTAEGYSIIVENLMKFLEKNKLISQ